MTNMSNDPQKQITILGDNALLLVTNQALLKSNRNIQKFALMELIVIVVLAVALSFMVTQSREVRTKAYGLTPDGRAIELKEIEGEIYSPVRVREWAGNKAKLMHTFTFRTIANGTHQSSIVDFMGKEAWEVFLKSLKRDGLIDDVIKKNAIVYAEYYRDKQPLYMNSYISPITGTKLHVVQVELLLTIDARSTNGTERNRQMIVPMEMHIGEVGLGKAQDGLLIGSIKRVVAK